VEVSLAWRRVQREIHEGHLGSDFDREDLADVSARVSDAEQAAKDEVWASYRYVVLADREEDDGLKVIDLGAGHSSASETLCGRIVAALRSEALLNESVGAGYLERSWPPALEASGAWPLSGLRQAFLDGTLTRLLDPDRILRERIREFVTQGDFGLACGRREDGTFGRVWFEDQDIAPEEVAFEADVFLLKKATAKRLREAEAAGCPVAEPALVEPEPGAGRASESGVASTLEAEKPTLRVVGTVRPEIWNRLGVKILPRLQQCAELRIGVEFTVRVPGDQVDRVEADLRQILDDLELGDTLRIQ
jgi:hypothetical protein